MSTGDLSFATIDSFSVDEMTVSCSTTETPFSEGLANLIGLPLLAAVRVKVSGFLGADFKVVMVVFVVVVRGAGACFKLKVYFIASYRVFLN